MTSPFFSSSGAVLCSLRPASISSRDTFTVTGWYCCWPPFCSALQQPKWTSCLQSAFVHVDLGMQATHFLPGHEVPGKEHSHLSTNILSAGVSTGPHLPARHIVTPPGVHKTCQGPILQKRQGTLSKMLAAFQQQEGTERPTSDPPSPQALLPAIAVGRAGQPSCHACPGAHTLPASCTRRTPAGNTGCLNLAGHGAVW